MYLNKLHLWLTLLVFAGVALSACQKAEPAIKDSTDPIQAVNRAFEKLKETKSYYYSSTLKTKNWKEFFCVRPDNFWLKEKRTDGSEFEYIRIGSDHYMKKGLGAWEKVPLNNSGDVQINAADLGNADFGEFSNIKLSGKSELNGKKVYTYSYKEFDDVNVKLTLSEDTGLPLKMEKSLDPTEAEIKHNIDLSLDTITFDYSKKVDIKPPM